MLTFNQHAYQVLSTNRSLDHTFKLRLIKYIYRNKTQWAIFHKSWVRSMKDASN